jgi:hypothetical protein
MLVAEIEFEPHTHTNHLVLSQLQTTGASYFIKIMVNLIGMTFFKIFFL